ncbi:MAG: hypothetical protein J5993_00785 [Clostridia bacterium]|nr:hypothetical protein [Clostridia bacterium]
MANVETEAAAFMRKCDDLISSKFILADAKISELLKSISVSKELCNLFRQVTEEFSYARAKEEYIAATPDGSINRKVIILPEDIYEQIAFVFCLLVDFDSGNLDFNQFLQEYYNVDGSFTESYSAFTNQLIKPFKNSVRQALKSKNIEIGLIPGKADERTMLLKELRVTIVRLRKTVAKIVEDADSRFGMNILLSAMLDALSKEDYKSFKALTIGYTFGENYVGIATDDLKRICEIMGRLKL